jgi:hypothetical protein
MRGIGNEALRRLAAFVVLAASLVMVPAAGAADPVRNFDGVDDQVQVRATAATNVTGAVTMVALVRPDVIGERDLLSLHNSAGAGTGYDLSLAPSGAVMMLNGTAWRTSSTGLVAASQWALVAVTKASGTATPRFHVYRYDLASWTHENAGSTLGNGGSAAGGTVRLGAWEDGYEYDGRYAAAALYPTALSDMAIETLDDSYANWLTASPAGMWIFNQVHVSHPVLDETGGGADEVDAPSPSVVANASPISGDPDTTIFRGDFSTGDLSQWWEDQEVGATASVSVGSSSPSPPAGETHYGRYSLQAGDERAEVYHGMELAEGEDVYVRFLARLSAGFPAETGVWGQLIWQLHQEGGGSPPVAMYIDGNPAVISLTSDVATYWEGGAIDEEEWHEYIIRVKHSDNDAIGFVELWVDDVKQTLVNSQDRMYGETLVDAFNYPKSGYYRDDDMVGSGEVQIAGYRIARDKNDLP